MGKPRWWVCGDCKSLNDLPAHKCYHCRATKPDHPALMDDEYSQVGSGSTPRVGVSVDLSRVSELTTPDPVERAPGGALIERYDLKEDEPLEAYRDPSSRVKPPPMRDPRRRSIASAGGLNWTYGLADSPGAVEPAPGGSTIDATPAPPARSGPPPMGSPPPVGPSREAASPRQTVEWPAEDPLDDSAPRPAPPPQPGVLPGLPPAPRPQVPPVAGSQAPPQPPVPFASAPRSPSAPPPPPPQAPGPIAPPGGLGMPPTGPPGAVPPPAAPPASLPPPPASNAPPAPGSGEPPGGERG